MTNEWQRIGSHQVRVEGDLFHLKWIGTVTAADVQGLILVMDRTLVEHARIFVIVDARHANGADAGARKATAKWSNYHLVAAVAYIGASLTVRVIVSITVSARRILGHAPPGPIHFVDTEDAARACIEAERRKTRLD